MKYIKQKFNFYTEIYTKDRRKSRPNSQVTFEIRISAILDLANLMAFLEDSTPLRGEKGNKLSQYLEWNDQLSWSYEKYLSHRLLATCCYLPKETILFCLSRMR